VRDSHVNREQPPASTLVVVKQLFRPDLLVEVDAIAVTND
jgi:enamine deaminase RidA (YjgF/YER057c/UK114 family)